MLGTCVSCSPRVSRECYKIHLERLLCLLACLSGVDGIITDRPDLARQVLSDMGYDVIPLVHQNKGKDPAGLSVVWLTECM